MTLVLGLAAMLAYIVPSRGAARIDAAVALLDR
jgi:hypothetical protein